jgi:hypothetical protein
MSVAPDASRAVQATIPISGGTVSAIGKDNARFTLTIPANALLEAQVITLTPIAATAGRPITSGAAVQIDPDGLRLYQPATLLIEPATPVPLAQQVAMGWGGNGRDVHLEPLELRKAELSMRLTHFSGYSVGPVPVRGETGNGYATDGSVWTDYTPEDFENRAHAYLAELVQAERKAALEKRPGDPEYSQKVEAVLKHYYELVIQPLMKEVETNCKKMPNAMKGISFARQAAILGLLENEANAVMQSAFKGATNCWEEEKKRCRSPSDVERTRSLIAQARQLQILGGTASLEDVPVCKADWSLSANATVTNSPGTQDTFVASVSFVLDPTSLGVQRYVVQEGTVTWSLSGTRSGGACRETGGPVTFAVSRGDAELIITPGSPPQLTGRGLTPIAQPVKVVCGTETIVESHPLGSWLQTGPVPIPLPAAGQPVSGSYSDGLSTWQWRLTPH